jgi:hypothetical protein
MDRHAHFSATSQSFALLPWKVLALRASSPDASPAMLNRGTALLLAFSPDEVCKQVILSG